LKMWLVMQLSGTPFTPHCTKPLVMAGSGLLKFRGTATKLFPELVVWGRTRNPKLGSRKTPAATDGLYACCSQLYAVLLALCQEPNRPRRMPKFNVILPFTRQSS